LFLQQLINALSLGSVYSLFALGFTLIFGVLAVINLSHGAVFMVSAYASLVFVNQFHFPLWLAILIGCAFGGITGAGIDFFVLGRLRKRGAPHLVPMVATIGVGIFLTSLVQGIFGAENRRFDAVAIPSIGWDFGDQLYINLTDCITVVLAIGILVSLLCLIRYTKQGKALRAIAENPRAAKFMGIDSDALFRLVAAAAGVLGGIAGILFGISYNAVTPFMGQSILDKGIAIIIIGVMGDVRGAFAGGMLLGFAEVMSVAYLSSGYRDAISFGLLFLILLAKPTGLFGRVLERKD
jgi:branched-chain amino acid transport system permease protein